MNPISLLSPSIDSETHQIIGTTDYRIVENIRYRFDDESPEEYEAFLDSVTLIRIPLRNGDEDDQCKRAFALIHQWWKIGKTHQS